VALFERRKGYGDAILDRRRTYVDILERVLAGQIRSDRARERSRFLRRVKIGRSALNGAVGSVEVQLLDDIDE